MPGREPVFLLPESCFLYADAGRGTWHLGPGSVVSPRGGKCGSLLTSPSACPGKRCGMVRCRPPCRPTMQYHRAAVFKLPVAIGGIHSPDVTVPWGLS